MARLQARRRRGSGARARARRSRSFARSAIGSARRSACCTSARSRCTPGDDATRAAPISSSAWRSRAPSSTRSSRASASACSARSRSRADDLAEARLRFKRSLTVCRDAGDKRGEANALRWLAQVDLQRGDLASARRRLAEALRAFRAFEMREELLGCLEDHAELAAGRRQGGNRRRARRGGGQGARAASASAARRAPSGAGRRSSAGCAGR